MLTRFLGVLLVAGLAVGSALPSAADDGPPLADLSLEELLDVPVVSAAKKATSLAHTAAAAYVVTADDIQRFGFRSVPEALRLVPGVDVARVDGSRWAVSVRGFNNRFANKLLVLVDGRTVYTPIFSGVMWEALGVTMEDIERIEVIRGPGATMWGTNAVNGVINIITKNASRTLGGLVVAEGGDFDTARGVVRYGAPFGNVGAMRVDVSHDASGPADIGSEPFGNDEAWRTIAALQLNLVPSIHDELSLQLNATNSHAQQTGRTITGVTPPYTTFQQLTNRDRQMAAVGRWQRVTGPASSFAMQVYWNGDIVEYSDSEMHIHQLDIDFNHRFRSGNHDLVWGTGARWTHARFVDSFTIGFRDAIDRDWIANAFVQDEITVAPGVFGVLAGVKVEKAQHVDAELQPNLRLIWTPRANQTLWASVARSTRSPSYAEQDISWTQEVIPAGVLAPDAPAAIVRYKGAESVHQESMVAWELGYRIVPHANVAIDAAAFWNHYRDLSVAVTQAPQPAFLDGVPYLEIPNVAANGLSAQTWGGEIALDAHPVAGCRLRAAWSLLRWRNEPAADYPDAAALIDQSNSPQHQIYAWASLALSSRLGLETAWRRVGVLGDNGLPGYGEMTTRLRWQPRHGLEFAVTVADYLHSAHREYIPQVSIDGSTAAIPRHVSISGRVEF